MTFLLYLFSKTFIEALGFTVLHSLWQAVILALFTSFMLYLWRKKSAQHRYWLSLSSLFSMMVIAVFTFCYYFSKENNSLIVNNLENGQMYFFKENTNSIFDYFHLQIPMVVFVWLIGVCFFSLKLCSGLAYVYYLKKYRLEAVPSFFQEKINKIATDFELKNKVKCWESHLVNSPLTIGWWKPILLFPIGVINQLNEKELEAILAHELAHILRKDFIVNILQNIIEIFFYFNPAVWWLSKQIREERENACDDIAVAYCNDALIYVKTLVKLQELNLIHKTPSLAMAFSKTPKNALLKRIKRIVHPTMYTNSTMEKFTATAILAISLLLLSFQKPTLKISQNTENQFITTIDTLPKTVKTENFDYQNQDISIKKRNGKVTFLKINGKEIPANEYGKHSALLDKMQQNIPNPPPMPSIVPPVPPSPPSPPDAPETPKFDGTKWDKLRFLTSEKTMFFECTKNLDCPKTDLIEVAYKDAQGFDKSVWFSTDGKMFFPDDLTKTGDEISFPIHESKYFYGIRKVEGYVYCVAESMDTAKKHLAASEKRQEMQYEKWRKQ